MSVERTPIFAYFFPQDVEDSHRIERTRDLKGNLISDLELARNTGSLLGKKTTYCLGDSIVDWCDSDPKVIGKQIELAKNFGINGFIVDTYVGSQHGVSVEEFTASLDNIAKLSAQGMNFASMFSLRLPRAISPVKKGYREPGRDFDLSFHTARLIVERAARLWDKPTYLHFEGNPYLALYGLLKHPDAYLTRFLAYMRDYAHKCYQKDLYLVGVGQTPQDFMRLARLDFEGITQYAGLPDFAEVKQLPEFDGFAVASQAEPIQDYTTQVDLQLQRCLALAQLGINNLIPSASVGWNASVRTEPVESIKEVEKVYPYTPIVMNSSPEALYTYLNKIKDFLDSTEIKNTYFLICAWNEIGESSALLPKLDDDNQIDFSYLEAVLNFARLLEENICSRAF